MRPDDPEQTDLDNNALLKQLGIGITLPKQNQPDLPVKAVGESSEPMAPGPVTKVPDQVMQSPAAMPDRTPYTGYTPKYAMEGFNFGRQQDPGKSAKDAFAMLANQAPPPPLEDKAALGAWFKQYIEPGMNALGHHVNSVNGDTFSYANPEGAYTIDYGRGAGAPGGALAWQAQDPTAGEGPGGARTFTPPTGGGTDPRTLTPPTNSLTPSERTPIDDILAEVQALTQGTASPMDARALMALLR